MKTILPLLKTTGKILLTPLFLAGSLATPAQSGPGGGSSHNNAPELVFKNPQLESGQPGANGAVYRFRQVTDDVDVLMKIEKRSSSQVTISNIDLSNTGYDNAFQPQIRYSNGNAGANTEWWVEFNMSFVRRGSGTPATVNTFKLTGLDIDGDNDRLREFMRFYGAASYRVEQNSSLNISNRQDNIGGTVTAGIEFKGPTTDYANVSTTATNLMTTLTFNGKNSITFRAGAATGNRSSSSANRMYSFWFKGFEYNNPSDVTLPVNMVSFTAILNAMNAAELKWTTATEKNASHFEVEKSLDGKNYTQAALVFAFGNTTETINYTFTDKNINTAKPGVIYYRIRTVDNDGSSELSFVRSIRIGKQEEALKIITYPNPAVNEIKVTIPSSWQGKQVTYALYNNNGQIVSQQTERSASQTETMDMTRMAPGYYIVKATCNGEQAQQIVIRN